MTDSEPGERGGREGPGRAHRCAWCGRVLLQPRGAGRPRVYCRAACRQQAYVARRLASATGADGLVVDRDAYERVLDRRAELELALADAERMAASGDPADVQEAMAWLAEHARRLLATELRAGRASS